MNSGLIYVRYILITSLILVVLCNLIYSQTQLREPSYFLLEDFDSESFSSSDSLLLDSCLRKFHNAQSDSIKISSLDAICQYMSSQRWEDYQEYQYNLILKYEKNHIKTPISVLYSKATALSNLAYIHDNKGRLEVAFLFYDSALMVNRKIGYKEGIATSLNNMGVMFREHGDFENAESYYLESLKIRKEINDQKGIATSFNNLGALYDRSGLIEKGLDYYQKALYIRKKIGTQGPISLSLNNIASSLDKLNMIDSSLYYYRESLKIRKQQGNKNGISYSLSSMADLYYKLGNLDTALMLSKQSLEYAKIVGYPKSIRNAAKVIYNVSKAKKDFKTAYQAHFVYIEMQDSLINDETAKLTIRQQTKHQFEKDQLVQELKKEEQNTLMILQLNRRNNIQYFIVLSLISVLLGIVISFGFIKARPKFVRAFTFVLFLIFFEFMLVLLDPYIESFTSGAPVFKFLSNVLLAILIFPLLGIFEKLILRKVQRFKT